MPLVELEVVQGALELLRLGRIGESDKHESLGLAIRLGGHLERRARDAQASFLGRGLDDGADELVGTVRSNDCGADGRY
jgi:hypothetical protein